MDKDFLKLSEYGFIEKNKISGIDHLHTDDASELIHTGLFKTDPQGVLNLVEQNKTLHQEILNLKRKFNQYTAEEKIKKEKLKNKYLQIDSENQRLQKLISEKDQDLYNQRIINEKMTSDCKEIQSLLLQKANQVVDWQREVRVLSDAVRNLSEQKNNLTESFDTHKNLFGNLVEKIKEASLRMNVLKGVIKKLKVDRAQLMGELQETRLSLALQKKYLQDLHNKLIPVRKQR